LADTIIPPKHKTAHLAGFSRFLSTGEGPLLNRRIEVSALHRNGAEFPLELTIRPVRLPDGYIFAAFARDITERNRAAQELLQAQADLEKRVKQRTKEVSKSNAALRREIKQGTKMQEMLTRHAVELRRSNAELEQFAYVASHDLKEPLRMVTSYLELIERRYKEKLDKDADEFIGFAVDGAERMRNQIDGLLAYSRVGTGPASFEPVDCETLLDRAVKDLARVVTETGAKITHNRLPTVKADAIQLTQLFENLIANAIKFCNGATPEVQISAKRKPGEWQFAVRDNGIGIEPQYAERIFVLFQRLHNRSKYPGTGIGLAICKKIVERHGGRIWVESQPGKGSTFYFTVPHKREVSLWSS